MPISPLKYTSSLKQIKEYLSTYSILPQKKLGQNFLIDNNIKDIIIRTLDLQREESVFEIGTGLGDLTMSLIPMAKHVFSIEKDIHLKPALDDILSPFTGVVTIIYQDILDFDLNHFLKQAKEEGFLIDKIVGNLPYSISFPLLKKIIEARRFLKVAVILVQREVGERILAEPNSKNYGLLSVFFNYYTKTEKIHLVKRNSFFPIPKVESLLLKIHFLSEPKVRVVDEELFFQINNAIFQYRRKNLSSALRMYFKDSFEKDNLKRALEKRGIDPEQRGDTLSLEQLSQLTGILKGLLLI